MKKLLKKIRYKTKLKDIIGIALIGSFMFYQDTEYMLAAIAVLIFLKV